MTRVALLDQRIANIRTSSWGEGSIHCYCFHLQTLSSSTLQTTISSHSIPFVFFSHSVFCMKQLSSHARYNSLPSFQGFLTPIPFSSSVPLSYAGDFHCNCSHCTTRAMLYLSHSLPFKKTSVGLKTCKHAWWSNWDLRPYSECIHVPFQLFIQQWQRISQSKAEASR